MLHDCPLPVFFLCAPYAISPADALPLAKGICLSRAVPRKGKGPHPAGDQITRCLTIEAPLPILFIFQPIIWCNVQNV